MRRLLRSSPLLVLGVVFAAPTSANPNADTARTHVVAITEDGAEAQLDEIPGGRDLPPATSHLWIWSTERAPCRVAQSDLDDLQSRLDACAADGVPLRARVARSAGSLALDDDTNGEPDLELIAAPISMWREVSESWLPRHRISARKRTFTVPRTREPWRLRVAGTGLGTWWIEVEPDAGAVEIGLRPAEDRGLTVVDIDGQPVEGALLRLRSGSPGLGPSVEEARFRTAQDGRLSIPSLPDAETAQWLVSAPGYAAQVQVARIADLPSVVTLEAGGSIRGRCVDREGRPLEGIRVSAEASLSKSSPIHAFIRAETDELGRFELADLPLGQVTLLALSDRTVARRHHLVLDQQVLDLGAVTLRAGATLRVAVRDPEGRPVAGARVEIGPGRKAVSDRRGEAEIGGVDPEAATAFRVRADGFLDAKRNVDRFGTEPLDVVLEPAFLVSGRFVDAEGVSLGPATLRLELGSKFTEHEIAVDGSFALELQPRRQVSLSLRSPRARELVVPVAAGEGGRSLDLGDLVAPAGRVVTGLLLDDASGLPVPGALVRTPRPESSSSLLSWVRNDFLEATSDAEGRFELVGLAAAPATLRVEVAGYARRYLAVDAGAAQQAAPVDLGRIWLVEGSTLTVLVPPAEAARDVARDGSQGDILVRADLRGDWNEQDMLTAPARDGEATIRHVPEGRALVTAVASGDVLCERWVDVAATESVVDCRAADRRVDGFVTVGGRAATGGRLVWAPSDEENRQSVIVNQRTTLARVHQNVFRAGRPDVQVAVQADGSFSTDRVRAGRWAVTWIGDEQYPTPPQAVEIAAEQDNVTVRLDYEGGILRGRVVDEDGAPVEGARVLSLETSASTISRADGDFVLTGMAPGQHRVHARSRGLSSQVASTRLDDLGRHEPIELVLEERRTDKVSVLVYDGDGPASGSFVFVESDRGALSLLNSDLEGIAELDLWPPLPERVRAAAYADGRWTFGDWVEVAKARAAILLPIESTGSVSIETESERLTPRLIAASGGWDVSKLMLRLGRKLFLDVERPAELRGLPTGTYRLQLAGETLAFAVRENEMTELSVR